MNKDAFSVHTSTSNPNIHLVDVYIPLLSDYWKTALSAEMNWATKCDLHDWCEVHFPCLQESEILDIDRGNDCIFIKFRTANVD